MKLKDAQKNEDPLTGKEIEKPCLDHDHKTGYIRLVLDYNSNQFLGKIESARRRYLYKFTDKEIPKVLRAVAGYLEMDYTDNPIHPKFASILVKRFSRMSTADQKKILGRHGIEAKTNAERTKEYKKWLFKEEHIYKLKV